MISVQYVKSYGHVVENFELKFSRMTNHLKAAIFYAILNLQVYSQHPLLNSNTQGTKTFAQISECSNNLVFELMDVDLIFASVFSSKHENHGFIEITFMLKMPFLAF